MLCARGCLFSRASWLKPRPESIKLTYCNKDVDPELNGVMTMLMPCLKYINGVMKVKADQKKLKRGDPAGLGGYVVNVKSKAS